MDLKSLFKAKVIPHICIGFSVILCSCATVSNQPQNASFKRGLLLGAVERERSSLLDNLGLFLVQERQNLSIEMGKAEAEAFIEQLRLAYGYAYEFSVEEQGAGETVALSLFSRYNEKDFEILEEHAPKLSDPNLSPQDFTFHLTHLVHIHTGRAYLGDPYDYWQLGDMIAYRLNHSTLHCVRQGILALIIVELLLKTPGLFRTDVVDYVLSKTTQDPSFKKKLQFVSSFQRTGRESEASFDPKPLSPYRNYGRSDVEFFRHAALKSGLFEDESDIQHYADGLGSAAQNMGEGNPLGLILFSAHTLDLRRMVWYDPRSGETHLQRSLTKDESTLTKLNERTDSVLFNTGSWYPEMPEGALGELYEDMYSEKWLRLHQPENFSQLSFELTRQD